MKENIENLELQEALLKHVTENNKDKDVNIVFGKQNIFKDHAKMEITKLKTKQDLKSYLTYKQTKAEAEEELSKWENNPGFYKNFGLILQHYDNIVDAKIAIYHIIKCADLDTLLKNIVDKIVAKNFMSHQVVMSTPMIEAFQYFTQAKIDFSIDNYRKRITPRLEVMQQEKEKKANVDKGGDYGNTES